MNNNNTVLAYHKGTTWHELITSLGGYFYRNSAGARFWFPNMEEALDFYNHRVGNN